MDTLYQWISALLALNDGILAWGSDDPDMGKRPWALELRGEDLNYYDIRSKTSAVTMQLITLWDLEDGSPEMVEGMRSSARDISLALKKRTSAPDTIRGVEIKNTRFEPADDMQAAGLRLVLLEFRVILTN